MAKEVFDFKQVGVSSNTGYLVPGMYNLSMREAKYVKPDGKKTDGTPKTTYLEVTFGGEQGQLTHKYFITPKAFERLQTIYTSWFDKGCDQVFESTDGIGIFFEKAFNSDRAKKTSKRMIVGGRQVGDKVYADVPFSRYIVPDDADYFKEGPFAKDSADWLFHVKIEKNAATASNDVMLPFGAPSTGKEDFADDLPF